jgi:magnesium-protoporphyrin IX monomethyl ester (oxidative) cyclase
MSGTFVRHAPLSLLYTASLVVKAGYDVEIFDARLNPSVWREEFQARLSRETMLVGISVMTGPPVTYAMEIASLVKATDPAVKVVWGGPFATFNPQIILEDDGNSDYVVSGYGSKPLLSLVESLAQGREPSQTPGLFQRGPGGKPIGLPADWTVHEILDYRDIPYHLILDYSAYGQLDQKRIIFSLYSSMGCPYQCGFCSSPALYKTIQGQRWQPLPVEEVTDHIQYVIDTYGAQYIYFIDDDSFVNLDHVEGIIDSINRRGIKVKLGFRGARINEIKKMSHAFLDKLAAAGTDILHIGAETGSNRLLNLVRKNCTVEDILECNRKLGQHPQINAFYNFIVGLPTETLEDLKATAALMLRLIDDNFRCIISTPNVFRPLPGTELFDLARKDWDFDVPDTLQGWARMEVETEYDLPWMASENKRFINMMLMASYFIDDKINKMETGNTLLISILKMLNRCYRPIARFRLRRGFSGLLVERTLYNMAQTVLLRSKR